MRIFHIIWYVKKLCLSWLVLFVGEMQTYVYKRYVCQRHTDPEFEKLVDELIKEDKKSGKYIDTCYSLMDNQLTVRDYYRTKAALIEHFRLPPEVQAQKLINRGIINEKGEVL